MTKRFLTAAALGFFLVGGSVHAQTADGTGSGVKRNYFVKTSNVKEIPRIESSYDGSSSSFMDGDGTEKRDFISRNFRYISMCDWTPGMRFMCVPTKEDLVIKHFAEAKTGNMISSRRLANKVLVYDNHSNITGSLHEHVNFHLEENPNEVYYFEVPTASFDDYCYSKTGVPTLAYLGEVDMAMDSLIGKQVRVLVRDFYQDSEVAGGGGYKHVDIGDEKRGTVMTITKVGVGTRNFPVKIIVKEPDRNGREGKEYFQYVTISHTNCGLRDEDFERSDVLPHLFQGSFQLLDDRMAVTPELQAWVGKTVYTFFDTKMRNSKEVTQNVVRLSTFTVEDIFGLGDSDIVTLVLKGKKSGETYTKEVSVTNTKVTGKEEILNELFIEGDPTTIEDVRAVNMPFIQKQQVKKGFTEAEVRLALGEPTDVSRISGDIYQWVYQYKDDVNREYRAVKFNRRTKRVTQDMTR